MFPLRLFSSKKHHNFCHWYSIFVILFAFPLLKLIVLNIPGVFLTFGESDFHLHFLKTVVSLRRPSTITPKCRIRCLNFLLLLFLLPFGAYGTSPTWVYRLPLVASLKLMSVVSWTNYELFLGVSIIINLLFRRHVTVYYGIRMVRMS
jgi:hypothetical protein